MLRIWTFFVIAVCSFNIYAVEKPVQDCDCHTQTSLRSSSILSAGLEIFPRDSEYLILVVDTSGSMYNYATDQLARVTTQLLETYPRLKGIQVVNHMGEYLYREEEKIWINDSREKRAEIINALKGWHTSGKSCILNGLHTAANDLYNPKKKLAIFLLGDELLSSLPEAVDLLGNIPAFQQQKNDNLRIHAIGFPVQFYRPLHLHSSGVRFAAIMSELASRYDGTFIGLNAVDRNSGGKPLFKFPHHDFGGKRTLILLDISSSMGQNTNKIIRTKSCVPRVILNATKWYQSSGSFLFVDKPDICQIPDVEKWAFYERLLRDIVMRMPSDGQFQVYTFDSGYRSLVPGSESRWLDLKDARQRAELSNGLSGIIPGGSRNFSRVFSSIGDLKPLPEQVILITDGLPTNNEGKWAEKIWPDRKRIQQFHKHLTRVPKLVPINVVLLDQHRSPRAASEFWKLAMRTEGTFTVLSGN